MKKKPHYEYEPFSLKNSLIEKRDEEARLAQLEEKKTETQLNACLCPLCGYFTNSQEQMDIHKAKAHVFYPIKKVILNEQKK